MRFEKGEEQFGKRCIRTRVDRFKKHVPYHTPLILNDHLFSVLTFPLVGRVSVNSLYQQGGLFSCNVNKHSDNELP